MVKERFKDFPWRGFVEILILPVIRNIKREKQQDSKYTFV